MEADYTEATGVETKALTGQINPDAAADPKDSHTQGDPAYERRGLAFVSGKTKTRANTPLRASYSGKVGDHDKAAAPQGRPSTVVILVV